MRILVVGGSGHSGSYLTQMLVDSGHRVTVASRGKTKPHTGPFDKAVNLLTIDLSNEQELCSIKGKFDTIVDYTGMAYPIWSVLKKDVGHLVACGSLWMYGVPKVVPTPELFVDGEEICSRALEIRYEQIKEMLNASGKGGCDFTAIMPSNFAGAGKVPIDTLGGRDVKVHKQNMRKEVVYLPEGADSSINPCDASDIAKLFMLAVNDRKNSAGQMFNVGSERSLTMTGLVNTYADIHGVKIPIERVSWKKYVEEISPSNGHWWHFYSPQIPDITKAKALLGYKPTFTSEQALERAVRWMKDEGLL